MQSPSQLENYELFKEQGYLYYQQAMLLYNNNNSEEALSMYQRALECFDKALEPKIDTSNSTHTMRMEMKKSRSAMLNARVKVVFRIQKIVWSGCESSGISSKQTEELCNQNEAIEIDSTNNNTKLYPKLPSAQEDPTQSCLEDSQNFSNVHLENVENSNYSMKNETTLQVTSSDVILTIAENVQVLYIKTDGSITELVDPAHLHIYKSKFILQSPEVTYAIMQIGTWIYPLISMKTPAIQSSSLTYLFPDIDGSFEGNCIAIVLPNSTTEEDRTLFENVFHQFTIKKEPENHADYDAYLQYSKQISKFLSTGAEWIGWGLVQASVKGEEILKAGSTLLKNRWVTPCEPKEVDPKLKMGLEAAAWITDKTAKSSGYVATKASNVTANVGKYLAPRIQEGSIKVLGHFTEQNDQKSKKQIAIASELGGGCVSALSVIYRSLENSRLILANSIADNTVDLVQHKYGQEVGKVTKYTFDTVGNAYTAVNNATLLGPKSLAKRAVKDTGKKFVCKDA